MGKIKMYEQNEISFKELFNMFYNEKELENLAKDSLSYYKRCYKRFCEFFDPSQPAELVTEEVIQGYNRYLQGKDKNHEDVTKITKNTVNTLLRGLRTILNYGSNNGYLTKQKVKMVKVIHEVKEVYTDKELERLLKKPNMKECTFVEYRSWVVTSILLGTACRISTLINIKIEDVNLVEREIIYRQTKNKRQSIIPISDGLAKILVEYLKIRNANSSQDYLICTENGNKIAIRSLQQQIKRYNLSRGVNRTSAHVYRNTFAKDYLRNGGDLFKLQKILCHSTLEMVKLYVEMYANDLKVDFNTYSPLDKRMKSKGNKISVQ